MRKLKRVLLKSSTQVNGKQVDSLVVGSPHFPGGELFYDAGLEVVVAKQGERVAWLPVGHVSMMEPEPAPAGTHYWDDIKHGVVLAQPADAAKFGDEPVVVVTPQTEAAPKKRGPGRPPKVQA